MCVVFVCVPTIAGRLRHASPAAASSLNNFYYYSYSMCMCACVCVCVGVCFWLIYCVSFSLRKWRFQSLYKRTRRSTSGHLAALRSTEILPLLIVDIIACGHLYSLLQHLAFIDTCNQSGKNVSKIIWKNIKLFWIDKNSKTKNSCKIFREFQRFKTFPLPFHYLIVVARRTEYSKLNSPKMT